MSESAVASYLMSESENVSLVTLYSNIDSWHIKITLKNAISNTKKFSFIAILPVARQFKQAEVPLLIGIQSGCMP